MFSAVVALPVLGAAGSTSLLTTLLPLIVLIVIFYFLLIRPQQKRSQAHQRLVKEIQPGDEVVTIGGLFGEVVEMSDDRVLVEVYDGTQMEFLRTAISRRIVGTEASDETADVDVSEEPHEETTDETPSTGNAGSTGSGETGSNAAKS